jgi:hypothetical protein
MRLAVSQPCGHSVFSPRDERLCDRLRGVWLAWRHSVGDRNLRVTRTLPLFHGTTVTAAQRIVEQGFVHLDPQTVVAEVAKTHDLEVDQLWKVIADEPQFYLDGAERTGDTSFTPGFDAAAHSWAQRAPESRREALWAAWLLTNPDHVEPFHLNVDGQVWVLAHLIDDQPAVIRIDVTMEELVEWEGMAVVGGRRLPLAPFLQQRFGPPEIAFPHELAFPPNDITVTPVERHVELDVYASLLGVDMAGFVELDKAGALGARGAGRPQDVTWWPLETVSTVLTARDRSADWSKCCSCLR